MNSRDLSPKQARLMAEKLRPTLGYLTRLQRRRDEEKFPAKRSALRHTERGSGDAGFVHGSPLPHGVGRLGAIGRPQKNTTQLADHRAAAHTWLMFASACLGGYSFGV